MNSATQAFRAARDTLVKYREDYAGAMANFEWPRPEYFNWALDHFDVFSEDNDNTALCIVDAVDRQRAVTFADMSTRSNQVANHLRSLGVKRGESIMLMLGNVPELWETMLAAIKLGAPFVPCSVMLKENDLAERIKRSGARHVVTSSGYTDRFEGAQGARVCIDTGGGVPADWVDHEAAADCAQTFEPDADTRADEAMIYYFTSGTTSRPKLVVHTHATYPIGHLSTMYWVGIKPGDVHFNLSSPGWAKHAWSCFFAPWNAEATNVALNMEGFDADALLQCLARHKVNTFCAPPTVWRMLIQKDLAAWKDKLSLRELVSAGEPLNPEVIDQIRSAWGLTIRDGYGQTETCAQVANSPSQELREGSMGRPLPGYDIALLDADDKPADEGEICLKLDPQPPVGLMPGYLNAPEKTAEVMRNGYYHTGDVGQRDADGYITYVGRADDVFKASDYRISPFELESVMITHEAITEAAVIPSKDPLRTNQVKAFVTVRADVTVDDAFVRDLFLFTRRELAAYKRVRRIQFVDELPKTISGKIRRVELRAEEAQRREADQRGEREYLESDFPGIKDEIK